jgi:hypothetical protein
VECIEELYIAKILPFKLQIALNYSRTRTFLSDLEILFRTVLGMGLSPALHGHGKFHDGAQAPSEFTDAKLS